MKYLNIEIKHRRDRLNKKLLDRFKRGVYDLIGLLSNVLFDIFDVKCLENNYNQNLEMKN
jgi:hypothetical protein